MNKKVGNTFKNYPTPTEANLWLEYSTDKTIFKLWSPTADAVKLNFYKNGHGGKKLKSHSLKLTTKGIWAIELLGNLEGIYYTYQIQIANKWLNQTPGIYAKAVGVNGERAMVLNLEKTNPINWPSDKRPQIKFSNEAIIYELHIRDFTIYQKSGSSTPGKYLGLVEENTKGPHGIKTGIAHLKDLGITHVHLLPTFDFYSIDESKLENPQYNWGYDPQNYNVPEGSFATDPFNAAVRIQEFKKMILSFHNHGIGVILDVVYNHTGQTEISNFNKEVPDYYYRKLKNGAYSNASGCGNETASERLMMQKFIIESVTYWAKEYHIDGFRFDLMAIHDIKTMNEVSTTLKKINKNIILYGEGWTANNSTLPKKNQALKTNIKKMPSVAAFCDELRDGLKGSVFKEKETGFVSGKTDIEESIKFGIVGAIKHPQINYKLVNYSDAPWANNPWQSISYVSCHDNHTLYDKLKISKPKASEKELIAMDKLANAIVLTGQGTPFLHAGAEFLRTKNGENNSYNLPDDINQIDWNLKLKNFEVYNYYKNLIAFRKKHPAFRMTTGEEVRANLEFKKTEKGLVSYIIKNNSNGDIYKNILVIYNARKKEVNYKLKDKWQIAISGNNFYLDEIKSCKTQIKVAPISMSILYQK
ncbi:type I pullulanase [Aurantibacter sp.]|uniref:type I pullulanase n=1 Tax=Aurantibacter sp. TaxID=2807103 RepID=UPI003264B570